MPEIVSCPHCGRRASVPDRSVGKRVKCPGCAETFQATMPAPELTKTRPVRPKHEAASEDEVEAVDDAEREGGGRGRRDEGQRSRRDKDEDDPRPTRRRPADEEDEEGDAPRIKKMTRQAWGPVPPWLLAIGVALGCVVVSFLVCIAALGTEGIGPAKDGPVVKYIALGLAMVGALALLVLGVDAVNKREVTSRYYFSEYKITGTWAVVLGMFQTAVGGCLGGWVVYGLFFTFLRGR
jgi:hypothetical protein